MKKAELDGKDNLVSIEDAKNSVMVTLLAATYDVCVERSFRLPMK